ncbi:MAG TPA: hypothetical protein PKD91_12050, partial [Bacteroidia bacterium]|nr:hypothetical protein [Bacteroidia bacterium]
MKNKLSFLLILILAVGCSENKNKAEQGNAVSGSFTIFVDKNSYPLVKVLSESFLSVYPDIEIAFDTGNGSEMISKIASLKVQSAVSCRPISEQDSLALNSRKIFFRQFHFVSDAVAVITNKSDSTIIQNLSDPVSLFTDCEHKSGLKICTTNPGSDINYSITQLIPGAAACMKNWVNAETAQGV